MTTLNASQLFTPLPSGVSDGVTPLTVPSNTWLANILANAGNLPVTSWQSGSTAWTELLLFATGLAQSDTNISLIAQGALLDFAATGTVTYVNAKGVTVTVPVTPDPSIPAQNPTGALGWLDALADSVYATDRLLATYASGPLYIANTTGSSLGTYLPGTFHVANTATGATYHNTSTFAFSSTSIIDTAIVGLANVSAGVFVAMSGAHGLSNGNVVYLSGCGNLGFGVVQVITSTGFNLLNVTWNGQGGTGGLVWGTNLINAVADAIGPASNAAPGQVTTTTTSVPGGAVGNPTVAWSGTGYESNTSLAARCRYKLQSLSVNGPKGAYQYYALTAGAILAAQTPPATLTSPVTRTVVGIQLGTGIVTTTVASANGDVPGVSNLNVTGATNAAPIVLTVSSTTGITSGMTVRVQGVTGNTAANGLFVATVASGTTLSLNGSSGNGAYVSGGQIEAGDLGLVDSVIQAYAVPNATTALTQTAAALNVTVTAIVYVPIAFLADYGTSPTNNKGATALTGYFPNIPIGGILGVDGQTSGVIPVSAISELLFDAGQSAGRIYTVSVSQVLMNIAPGLPPADLIVGSTQVAVLSSVSIQVVGI